ncbi:hypothetical protein J4480_01205 [Candidatus Woesearchaeota archaeon]|nr:hypothetical protein [Candidatus Woesearchaeota archaeon]
MEEGIEARMKMPVRFPSEPWAVLQPDPSTPYDFFGEYRQRFRQDPEKMLMLAVLEDAVGVYQKNLFERSRKGKAKFREAEEYILEEGSDWPYSFENACEYVGLNPDYVRQGLTNWKEQRLANALPKSAKRKYITSR